MEIELKFLIKKMPDLSGIKPVPYERYYLKIEDGLEERIQRKGEIYEYEIKKIISPFQRTKDKKIISAEEFEELKKSKLGNAIIRDSYHLPNELNISIKIYHGDYEGLKRAEVEFDSEKELLEYTPKEWMGKEIKSSPLSRDSRLLHLSKEEFETLLKRESED